MLRSLFQAQVEAIPGPCDVIMLGLNLASDLAVDTSGTCAYPILERFLPFVEWYRTSPHVRLLLLSAELRCASTDSAVLRAYRETGNLLLTSDVAMEPVKGKPFPPAGAAADRWFSFRGWYLNASSASVRRVFQEQRIQQTSQWLQVRAARQLLCAAVALLVPPCLRGVDDGGAPGARAVVGVDRVEGHR
jgi:hypothetical protein